MDPSDGIVFDIKKFSLHDGPGIRTTVFLKGCPLQCTWCHNPEGISPRSEIHFFERRCIACLDCLDTCLYQAISWETGTRVHHLERCQRCGLCVEVCPAEALQLAGTPMGVADVLAEIEKDVLYYDQSGGGATFSGGEPLVQIEFLTALLAGCRDRGIHTAVDTCGHVPYAFFEQVHSLVDLFLYDVKLMDPQRHLEHTGVPNQRILGNLESLARNGAALIARIPIIPGINDDSENIDAAGVFLASLGNIQAVNILPYHRAAAEKYQRMNNLYTLRDLRPPSDDHLFHIASHLESFGLLVNIGG
jgi:pyruvate formate lyase activating enzyme